MISKSDFNVMGHLPPTSKCSLTELELLNKFYNCLSARSREDNFYKYKCMDDIDNCTQANATAE